MTTTPHFDALSGEDRLIVGALAGELTDGLLLRGIRPLWDDRVAYLDDAIARYYTSCKQVQAALEFAAEAEAKAEANRREMLLDRARDIDEDADAEHNFYNGAR